MLLRFAACRKYYLYGAMWSDDCVRPNLWIPAVIAWIGVIFFSSTSAAGEWAESAFAYLYPLTLGYGQSNTSSEVTHLLADKGFHVGLFFVLAFLLWQAVPEGKFKVQVIFLIGSVVGCCSELLQQLFPDRDPAVRDVLINMGGTGLGILFCLLFAKHQRRIGQLASAGDRQN